MSKGSRNKEMSAREKAQYLATGGSTSKNKTPIIVAVSIIAFIAIVVAIIIGLQKQNSGIDLETVNQPTASADMGVIVGADRKVVKETKEKEGISNIIIYQDYLCGGCKAFEESFAGELDTMLDTGLATIEYRSIGMLVSSSNYSARAANVALCAADSNPDSFYELNKLMYANQPSAGDMKNAELIKLAESLGAKDIESCVTEGKYRGFVKKVTDFALNEEKIAGTPTVMVNGEKIEIGDSLIPVVTAANEKLKKANA